MGIPNLDLAVPQTGGKTCRSIKSMAASEMEGSAMCATLQKKEGVCCPRPRPFSLTKTIFVISLQGTPGAHESNQGRLDLFKEKWRMACGSSSDSTNIEHCPAAFDKRRGYGVTLTWMLCLWRARQLDEEVVIFVEDDARLFENSTQEFCDVEKRGELLSKLPSDTFVAWLGGHTWSYEDSAVPYRRVRNSYGAYGFLVPRNSIDDFHAALQHGLIHGSKDRKQNVHHNSLDPEPNFYRAAREYHKKIYAFNPLVVWHEGGYSNTWGKVRGNITGLERQRQGIKVGSRIANTKDRKRSVDAGHQRAVERIHSKRLPLPSSSSVSGGATTRCTFCEGEKVIPNLDLVVPKTGGHTCRLIKKMAAREINGSAICATLQKEERVCCPVVYDNDNNDKASPLVEPISSQLY
eukprot:CAMPEP_0201719710 /NCGR_PEP_ID=MMETSP0593-20130828/4870_1 /ASSEMBLY_ACC=CAM_ASM_000672 /TAXON_ID=267983 /ORGANISM="Skeletonema japonicum, Strain CCMP2506" /LENGTH=406 /DNA_ID=CAMNT_0048210227 /DNA_START=308 /DNA_END=1528 /DNA_ORIENTATION=+